MGLLERPYNQCFIGGERVGTLSWRGNRKMRSININIHNPFIDLTVLNLVVRDIFIKMGRIFMYVRVVFFFSSLSIS